LRLGEETSGQFSVLELEIRRRLLFAIGLLDTHSALDRGTIPILPSKTFRIPPLDVNDDDLTPSTTVPLSSSSSLPSSKPTDMSHMIMVYDAMVCQRKLYELSADAQNGWEQWTQKVETINLFEQSMRAKAYSSSGSNEPLEKLKRMSAEKIIISMQLLLRRPPYRQPQNTVPPWDDFDVMETATKVLEAHMQPVSIDLKPWAWKNWVQWHALAVVLAELTARPHDALSSRAYAVARKSFHYYAKIVADSESGMLWKPIAKLMRRVQKLRQDIGPEPMQELDDARDKESSSSMSSQLDLSMLDALEPFDFNFNNWDVDSGETTKYPIIEGNGDGIHDAAQPEDMPWLAWDYFLQDLHQPL
jgi:hypothetical protein